MDYDLSGVVIPKINDYQRFENLVLEIWKNDDNYENVQLNGRSGQSQKGVDVFGRFKAVGNWFGIQCKVREASLSYSEILEEIEKAVSFNPTLVDYKIITTLDRDTKTQENCRLAIRDSDNAFKVEILFWDDIAEMLKKEKNYPIYCKFYNSFFIDSKRLGLAIGRLVNLELGTGTALDTHFELMIGKIPNYKSKLPYNVNYYRNAYFIINFNECKMETFSHRFFPSDIEAMFHSKFDRYRISQWINSIKDIDEFIYGEGDDCSFYMSKQDMDRFNAENLEN